MEKRKEIARKPENKRRVDSLTSFTKKTLNFWFILTGFFLLLFFSIPHDNFYNLLWWIRNTERVYFFSIKSHKFTIFMVNFFEFFNHIWSRNRFYCCRFFFWRFKGMNFHLAVRIIDITYRLECKSFCKMVLIRKSVNCCLAV